MKQSEKCDKSKETNKYFTNLKKETKKVKTCVKTKTD